MKTKHLSAALMLPVLFTACTNEEFSELHQSVDLSNRPMAGDVTLTFNTGADSRLNADFDWEIGDNIGACLMDEYIPGQGTSEKDAPWMIDYKFVNYIQTNYKYSYAGESVWNNSDLLASGNYFFYYPYSSQLNARKAFEKYLNANQELKGQDTKSLRDLVNANQMYVGYKFVEGAKEGDMQPLNVVMDPVFAFPAFTIKNVGTQTRTITKIALQKDGKVWDLVATINPEGKTATSLTEDVTKAVIWSDKATLDENAITTATQIQVTMPENTTIGTGQTLKSYIVVPAGKYANGANGDKEDVKMYIYTTEGIVTVDLSQKHENSGTGAGKEFNVTNDVAFADVYPYTVNGKYFHCNVTFDDAAVNSPNKFTASSTEDLDTYLSWFKNISGTGSTILDITTAGDVTLSKKSYEILKNNRTIKARFVGNLNLAEGVGTDVLDLISFDATVPRFIQNFATINISGINICKVESSADTENIENIRLVNKGVATLNKTTNYGFNINNDGTVIVDATEGTKTVSLTSKNNEKFVNNGSLIIKSNLYIADQGIKNNGNVRIEANTTNAKIDNIFTPVPQFNSYIAGSVYVAEGAEWNTVGSLGTSQGYIENKGTIEVPAGGVYTLESTQEYTVNGKVKEYLPTIDNFGILNGVKNTGLVVMKGENSEIKSGKDSNGQIDNTECSRFVKNVETETVFVKFTSATDTKSVSTLIGNAKATKVVFENAGTLTITEEKDTNGTAKPQTLIVNNIDINGNLDFVGANKELNISSEVGGLRININSGTTLIKDYVKVILGNSVYGSFVNIKEGALLKVSNSAEFSGFNDKCMIDITGSYSNYGKMENIKK